MVLSLEHQDDYLLNVLQDYCEPPIYATGWLHAILPNPLLFYLLHHVGNCVGDIIITASTTASARRHGPDALDCVLC